MLCVLYGINCSPPVLRGTRLEENRKCRISWEERREKLRRVGVSTLLILCIGWHTQGCIFGSCSPHGSLNATSARNIREWSSRRSRVQRVLHVTSTLTFQHQLLLIGYYNGPAVITTRPRDKPSYWDVLTINTLTYISINTFPDSR